MAQTPNYDLFLTDDNTMSFLAWRNAMNGQENSNMTKIDTVLHAKADKSASFDLTLTPDGWSGQEQVVQMEGLSPSDNGIIGVCPGATDEQMEAAKKADLHVSGCGNGTLIIRAGGDIPTIDVPVSIIIFG